MSAWEHFKALVASGTLPMRKPKETSGESLEMPKMVEHRIDDHHVCNKSNIEKVENRGRHRHGRPSKGNKKQRGGQRPACQELTIEKYIDLVDFLCGPPAEQPNATMSLQTIDSDAVPRCRKVRNISEFEIGYLSIRDVRMVLALNGKENYLKENLRKREILDHLTGETLSDPLTVIESECIHGSTRLCGSDAQEGTPRRLSGLEKEMLMEGLHGALIETTNAISMMEILSEIQTKRYFTYLPILKYTDYKKDATHRIGRNRPPSTKKGVAEIKQVENVVENQCKKVKLAEHKQTIREGKPCQKLDLLQINNSNHVPEDISEAKKTSTKFANKSGHIKNAAAVIQNLTHLQSDVDEKSSPIKDLEIHERRTSLQTSSHKAATTESTTANPRSPLALDLLDDDAIFEGNA